ncbi:rCG35455 [Rattus norvegicus]|uniref:RCG35455 n=1 Tax=Rattus norvegicus TaxID=10116 RepID=A6HCP2_RAT|nr:rCG35455 [Rattus norvegicus]
MAISEASCTIAPVTSASTSWRVFALQAWNQPHTVPQAQPTCP